MLEHVFPATTPARIISQSTDCVFTKALILKSKHILTLMNILYPLTPKPGKQTFLNIENLCSLKQLLNARDSFHNLSKLNKTCLPDFGT